MAKHGNRSVSSKSGSADVLEALGANINLKPDQIGRCIDEVGVGFMFAPLHHGAMKHAAPVRRELGVKTIFNILGPLTNPAGARRELMGVFHPDLVGIQARVLQRLGSRHVMVVHGLEGLDEISIAGPTMIGELNNDNIEEYTISPQDFGLETYPVSAIQGGEPEENRAITDAILAGEGTAAHNAAIAANVAPLLVMAGKAPDFKQAAAQVLAKLASGETRLLAQALATLSHQEA